MHARGTGRSKAGARLLDPQRNRGLGIRVCLKDSVGKNEHGARTLKNEDFAGFSQNRLAGAGQQEGSEGQPARSSEKKGHTGGTCRDG